MENNSLKNTWRLIRMAVKLKALQRNDLKQSATKKIRERGDVPAVVYGKDKDPKAISINSLDLVKTVRDAGRNAIISLDIENDSTVEVMLHEYQMHPLKNEVVHADFYMMDLSEAMDVEVPLRLEGEAQGSKDGGVLQQPLFELQIRAKPNDIPEEIVVNIEELKIGDNITVSDLPKAEEYEFLDDEDSVIAVIIAPDSVEEEATEDVDLSVEPEVVGAEEDEE